MLPNLPMKKKHIPSQLRELGNMKFLVDECTGILVSQKLKELKYDSVSVIECMKGAEDEEILRLAVKERRVIITNDKDFGRLAGFFKPPGIILLRLKDESIVNKVRIVSFVVSSYGDAILGNILIVSEKKIRTRKIK
jgi:predicted nuclease of predicted toxin-antitoxin system